GDAVLASVREHRPAAVVLDIALPGLDGFSVCGRLKADPALARIPVIFVTTGPNLDDKLTGLALGADEFLSKPVEASELLVRVRTGVRLISMETREMALFALAKLAESRDNETGAHLERVREYSKALAKALQAAGHPGVDDEFVRNIYLTSPLHDIGKVGIPDTVLLKPDRLSDREFAIMKQHTLIGAETIDAVLKINPEAAFLRMARDIALTHHEQWTGGGYPHGLRGEAIPLPGRIVALADVYDALTSKRVYKAAFSHEVAQRIIAESSGTQFDPALAPIFLGLEPQLHAIRTTYAPGAGEAAPAPDARRAA
ncbi:MAG TPA: HD domain-containing phosphohydrolase, partial [Phycisphaerales bacterium]|nr:HD domain-containing phosphohydrolase [Phycisphaerales bacterium]